MLESLHIADLATIGFYFLSVVGFGIWSSFKSRKSVDGFFIARRSISFIPVGVLFLLDFKAISIYVYGNFINR